LIVGLVKRSLEIIDQMHRKCNARIANATKTKEKHGTKCNHNCNMSHKPIPLPLFGKSKSRQCFVKTTKCSKKYYLFQNLSATENVSENTKLKCLAILDRPK